MPDPSSEVFPTADPVGPVVPTTELPRADVVARVVAPRAEDADRVGVERSTIDALADAGLLGDALTTPHQREVAELLAGADASTWFCWAQHATPLRVLAGRAPGQVEEGAAALRERILPDLRAGRRLAAVAFAHLRRPGVPNPVATRVAGGWRLDGVLDWVTSWDIADDVLVMARGAGADADVIVCAYLPAGRGPQAPGLTVGEPLALLAMSGTHTRPVHLSAVHVPDESVGAVLDADRWAAADARLTADASPAAFGVARGALAELDLLARRRDDETLALAAAVLVDRCRTVREQAYALADADGPVSERLAVRAQSLDLATRATQAVVVARAGAAMRAGTSAERRVREALFLLVQAQTAAGRSASLRLLAGDLPSPVPRPR